MTSPRRVREGLTVENIPGGVQIRWQTGKLVLSNAEAQRIMNMLNDLYGKDRFESEEKKSIFRRLTTKRGMFGRGR